MVDQNINQEIKRNLNLLMHFFPGILKSYAIIQFFDFICTVARTRSRNKSFILYFNFHRRLSMIIEFIVNIVLHTKMLLE